MNKQIIERRKWWLAWALLLTAAFGFRLFIALRLPNDEPDDGRVYAQIARNVLEQHVYSHESEPPYAPSLIRLPGYPLFLAAIYSIAGHGNNTAVRVVQAVIDTATCALIALVAFQWVADERRKQTAAIAALALAAVCPFTAIYVSTILTEVPTNFLAVALVLVTTLAFKANRKRNALFLWFSAGVIAGLAVFFRPDSGLFAAATGLTILISAIITGRDQPTNFMHRLVGAIPRAAIFSIAFCLVLVPWTIRNQRVFHLFQPLSPTHGEMPGEFVPRGYLLWLRTWLDDERYIGPVLWKLDSGPITVDDFPNRAFDSADERARVATLLDKYNRSPDERDAGKPTPETKEQSPPSASNSSAANPTPEPSPSAEEEEGEGEEEDDSSDTDESPPGEFSGEMTPDIDAAFAQLAKERIARAPIRYYLILPIKRAGTLWLDTHSQYYPFEGELLPLEDLDHNGHQQYWLPLFASLTWLYSMLGVIGGWLLWRSGGARWTILAGLIIFLRLGFFATLENPEPRYTVELFPFLTILGGIAIGLVVTRRRNAESVS